jgi:hypothetical protein
MVGLLALALPFISAADTAADAEGAGEGDATASLLAAALEIEDLDGVTAGALGGLLGDLGGLAGLDTGIDLALLDGLTYATTREEPDAWASVLPYRLGDDQVGGIEANPGERHDADAIDVTGVSALLSGVSVSPFAVSADADEDGALALIEAVTASLDVLGDGGLQLGVSEVRSEVTQVSSVAHQDLVVDELSLALGDILPEELLRLLPIDALLDLLEELDSLGLLDGVDELRALLDALLEEVLGLLADLADLDLELLDEIDPALLTEMLDLRGTLDELDDLAGTIDGVESELEDLLGLLDGGALDGLTGDDTLGSILDGLADAVDDLDDGLVGDVGDELGGVLSAGVAAQDVTDALSTLEGARETLLAYEADGWDLPAGCTDALGSTLNEVLADADRLADCVEALTGEVEEALADLADTLAGLVDGLDDLLGPVLDLLDDLDGALDELLGLIDEILGSVGEIAGLELLSADEMVLEVAAAATATGGATKIECELGGLSVLGEAIGSASCDDGELTGPAVGAVAGALDLVEDVLTALPGVDAAEGLRLELLPEAEELITTEDDGTVVASAQAVLLELSVPSVTIDPSAAVEDLLDLPALTGDLLDLDGDLGELLGLLEGAGLTDLLGEVEDLAGQVTGLLGDVEGLLDDLDLPVLSSTIRTPAIDLVLDPLSEATFTAAQDGDPTDPGADPGTDPEPRSPATTQPTPTRDLPRTGGAFPLLGLLALAGAVGLRRTG